MMNKTIIGTPTTQHYREIYESYVKPFLEREDLVVDFLRVPYKSGDAAHSCLCLIAHRVDPSRNWTVYCAPLEYSWIVDTLVPQDFIDRVFTRFMTLKQWDSQGEAILIQLRDVVRVMTTEPFSLNKDRILTRVAGYITDMDEKHRSLYVFKPYKRVDYRDILVNLINYNLIPKVFNETLNIVITQFMERIQDPDYLFPPVVVVGASDILVEVISTEIKNKNPNEFTKFDNLVEIQGSYEEVAIKAISDVASEFTDDKVIVYLKDTYELLLIDDLPGPSKITKDQSDALCHLGYNSAINKVYKVSILAFGDRNRHHVFKKTFEGKLLKKDGFFYYCFYDDRLCESTDLLMGGEWLHRSHFRDRWLDYYEYVREYRTRLAERVLFDHDPGESPGPRYVFVESDKDKEKRRVELGKRMKKKSLYERTPLDEKDRSDLKDLLNSYYIENFDPLLIGSSVDQSSDTFVSDMLAKRKAEYGEFGDT